MAQAYTFTRDSTGKFVKWSGHPRYNLAGNPQNKSGVDSKVFQRAVIKGLQRWQEASAGKVEFAYWQGTNNKDFEPNSHYNGLSSIYFASHSGESLDRGLIALTQTWYDTKTGQIFEADIVLNDHFFTFTNEASHTTGGGNGRNRGGREVFIENAITHELGHALGLGHSSHLQSTMLFMEAPDQAHLSCDDWTAIRSYYGARGAHLTGALRGRVRSPEGDPIFGAHVLAISLDRGTVLGTAVTEPDGEFVISHLEVGPYALLIEPVVSASQVLTEYYGGVQTKVCSGWDFFRSFVTHSDGRNLKIFDVNVRRFTEVGSVSVSCSEGPGTHGVWGGDRMEVAPSVSFQGESFSFVDGRNGGGKQYYRLEGVDSTLRVVVNAYSLYSPVQVSLTLLDQMGNLVEGSQVQSPVYRSESAYQNFDASLEVSHLAPGDYILQVETRSLGQSFFPGTPASIDRSPFIVVTGSLDPQIPALASQIPFHPSCRSAEKFTFYALRGGKPPRYTEEDGTGFCSSVKNISGPPSVGLGSIVGWFMPYLMIFFVFLLRKRARLSWRLAPPISSR